MPLLQWAEPTEVLGVDRLRGPAHLVVSAHSQNRGALLPHRRRWLVGKILSIYNRWSAVEWLGSLVNGESNLRWRAVGCSPERSADGGATRQTEKLVDDADGGWSTVEWPGSKPGEWWTWFGVKGGGVLNWAVDRWWHNVADGESHRRHGRRVSRGGLRVEEYEWTTRKLEEAVMWPEEDGGELSTASSSSR
jgi:hypothetical protein